MIFREIEKADIDDILAIRTSTRENSFSMEDLAGIGVTPQSVAAWLEGAIRGWLCETDGIPAGFAMGDSATAEVLVLAVRPEYEGRGVGKGLMIRLQEWLWTFGHRELWLWSNPDSRVRAHGFYRIIGWYPAGEVKGNNEMLKLKKP